jgi:hypothetical protein
MVVIWYSILLVAGFWVFKNVQVTSTKVIISNYFNHSKKIIVDFDRIENLYVKSDMKAPSPQ